MTVIKLEEHGDNDPSIELHIADNEVLRLETHVDEETSTDSIAYVMFWNMFYCAGILCKYLKLCELNKLNPYESVCMTMF